MRRTSFQFASVGLGLIVTALASAAPPPEPARRLALQAPPATATDSVTVSPDGSLVATATGEGGIRLYNAHTGAFLRAFGSGGDRSVVFSPDGKMLTAAGFHMDKLTSLWDVQTGARLKRFAGHTEWESDTTAISPDGKLLASTNVDRQLLIWDIATGNLVLQLKDQPTRLPALAFSPDGKTLAVGGSDKSIRLLEIPSGKLLRSFTGHGDVVCTLAFSPDGRTLASGSCDWGFHRGHDWPRGSRGIEQCEWRLWDVSSGEPRRIVKSTGRLLSLAIAPTGKSLVCGIGKDVRLYDLTANDDGRVLTSHEADVTSVAITPDGAAVISGSHDQTVKRTNLTTAKQEWHAPGYYEQVNSVALSADGRLLLTGSSDSRFARGRPEAKTATLGPGSVRLWDLHTGRVLHQPGDPTDQILAVAISRDGQHLAAGGQSASGTGIVRAWNGATNRWAHHDHTQEVLAVALSPDGQLVASGSADGVVKIRDWDTGTTKQTLTGHQGGATSLVFSPNGKTLYCGEAPGSIRNWEVATGKPLDVYKQGESRATGTTVDRRLTSVGITDNGKLLLSCGSSVNNEFVDPAKLWNPQTGTLIREFAAENIHGRPTAISPDGQILATGGKSVKLWDAKTGQPLRELYGHLKRTQSIVFSADGRRLVAGGSYGTTNIWDVATGKHLLTLFAFPNQQNGRVPDDWIAYLPDGHYQGSPGCEKLLAWRIGNDLVTPATLSRELHRPDLIEATLRAQIPAADRPLLVPAPGSPVIVSGDGGALIAGDINQDGVSDVIWTAGKSLSAAFGGPNRVWNAEPDIRLDLESPASELALADVNHDNHHDLILAHHDSYGVTVLLGNGNGKFSPAKGSPFTARAGSHPHTHGLAIADVNGDHHPDIVTANNSDGDLSLLLGDGQGRFARVAKSPFPCGKNPYPIAAADLNGDGCADILVPNATHGDDSTKTLTILLGDHRGTLVPAPGSPLPCDRTVWFAAAGDLNGDGHSDVVATHSEGGSGATIWLNTGKGQLATAPGSPLQLGHGAWGAEIADMNRDGQADLVVAADEHIRVFLGDGRGSFKPAAGSPFPTGKGAWRLTIGDFNGDGKLDVATRCVEAKHITILYGND